MRCILALLFAITLCTADESADRQKEAKSLARQGSTAIPRLSELIFDEAPAVRAQAVKSLVSIGGQGSLDPIDSLCCRWRSTDPNCGHQWSGEFLFARVRPKRSFGILKTYWKQNG